MELQKSGISESALALRKLLSREIPGLVEQRISIGSPRQADEDRSNSDQRLNLFYYRVEMCGWRPAHQAEEAPAIRAFLMITPFGIEDTENHVSPGENDLRLMGEVIRVLHENPTITMEHNGKPYAQVQLMPLSLNMDEMNKIWSSQDNTVYRLSVGYEMALVPVTLDPDISTPRKVESVDVRYAQHPGEKVNLKEFFKDEKNYEKLVYPEPPTE